MKILNNFTPKYYKANEFICKEGQKPNEIMIILEGQWEIIKNNTQSKTFRGESGIGLLSESLINNKIRTVSEYHWIAEECTFYDRPLNYSVRSCTIVRLLSCPSEKMISDIPKYIRDSLKEEVDRAISMNESRLYKLENTKKYLLSIDHDISRTLPQQMIHLSEKYPNASTSALKNLRRVILPEVMHKPKFLLCKNSARVDPTFDLADNNISEKVISKFLERKRQGALDDPGNSYDAFLHLSLNKNSDKPRYLCKLDFLVMNLDESSFDERRMKHSTIESNQSPDADSRSSNEFKLKKLKAMHNSRVRLGIKEGIFRHDIDKGKTHHLSI